jgi:hypothetical protein
MRTELQLYNRERSGNWLKAYPQVRAWLARVAALPRYLALPLYDGAGGALVE